MPVEPDTITFSTSTHRDVEMIDWSCFNHDMLTWLRLMRLLHLDVRIGEGYQDPGADHV